MNTLVSVAIIPLGVGDSLSSYIAEVIKVIDKSGLSHCTTSMSTEIEGEWDDVMRVVKDAVSVFTDKGIRTNLILRADIRPGYVNTITSKVDKIESILNT